MFQAYIYSVILKMHITCFPRFFTVSHANVEMSEGTFCRAEAHIVVTSLEAAYDNF